MLFSKYSKKYFLIIAGCFFSASFSFSQQLKTKSTSANAGFVGEFKPGILGEGKVDTNWFIVERKKEIHAVLEQEIPVQLFRENENEKIIQAQQIALADKEFTRYVKDKRDKKALLNQIFGVYPARPGDIKKGTAFLPGTVMRVEMYNFAHNLTTIGIVDIFTQKVLSVNHYPQSQPDIPSSLKKLAVNIAVNSPEIEKALGFKPSADMPVMSSTKTALNRTKCERSLHLCVAPTFVQGSRALWAVVDLTDCRLVGYRWTNIGKDAPAIVVTERKLQNENISECFCEKINNIKRNNWQMDYVITSSDGLMISNVLYKDARILNSAKLVDWHISYSGTDGFGYSDAVGCPIFSQAAVVATEPPKISELIENDSTVGFVLEQKFYSELWPAACNYSYLQRYLFYNDGRFRVTGASFGRGCGNNGTYRPVFRIAFAGNHQSFYEWKNNDWQLWQKEKWQLQTALTKYTAEGYQYKISNTDGTGFLVEPGQGQFKDGGRGDNAYVYITKKHLDKDEGETDLITIGPCCNNDYRQGPEKFIDKIPENIVNTDIVVWYVPQMKNDDTPGNQYCWAETYYEDGVYKVKSYPCYAGPMFIPLKK